jgi:hypothetical protein
MDTRSKILTAPAVLSLGRRLAVATGTFNPLLAADACELEALRERSGDAALLAVVLPADPELLPLPARAEMVAALSVVDYVFAGDAGLIAGFEPVMVANLPDRTAVLLEQVAAAARRA